MAGPPTAEQCLRAAQDAAREGRVDLAARHVTAGERLLDESPEHHSTRCRLLITRAWVAFEQDGQSAAFEVLREAVDLARSLADDELVSLCLAQEICLFAWVGDGRSAFQLYQEHQVLLDHVPALDAARLHNNVGIAALSLHLLPEAAESFHMAADRAAEAGEPQLRAMAWHNVGYTDFLGGDIPLALKRMHEASEASELDPTIGLLDTARVLLEAGLVAEATGTLDEALASAERFGHGHLGCDIVATRALSHLLRGQPEAAARDAATAQREFLARGAAWPARRAACLRLRARLAAGEDSAALAASAAQVKREAEAADDAEAVATASLTLTALGVDDGSAPVTSWRSPLLSTRLWQVETATRVAIRAGDHALAVGLLDDALEQVREASATFGSADARAAMALHARSLAELAFTYWWRRGDAGRAVAAVLAWRCCASAARPVMPPADAQTGSLLSEARQAREDLRCAEHPDEVDDAAKRVLQAEGSLQARAWRSTNQVTSRVFAGPQEFGPYPLPADADATHVVFAHCGDEVVSCVAAPGEPVVVRRCGDADRVEGLARRLAQDVRQAAVLQAMTWERGGPQGTGLLQGVRAGAVASATALQEALRVPDVGRVAPVVVSCPSTLACVPWSVLPAWANREVRVCRAPRGRGGDEAWWGPALAATRVLVATGPDVPCSADEAARVARSWQRAGAVVDVREATTARDLVEAMSRCDVAHVAAHGTHHAENPVFSSLRCADGPAFAYELRRCTARRGLVVLASCDVGLAGSPSGGEPLGLASTFLAQGAGAVIASPAPLPDALMSGVFARLHEALAAGVRPARALVMAQQDLPDVLRVLCLYTA